MLKRILFITFLYAAIQLPGRSLAQSVSIVPNTDTSLSGKDSTLPKGEFGLKLGLNYQTITGDTWDHGYKPGIVGGVTAGMHKNKIGVRAEILISTSSYVSTIILDDTAGHKGDISIISLNIPVLFEYSFIPRLKLQAGIQYSSILSAKNRNALRGDPKVLYKGSEFSGVLGLEAKLPANFSVGARYILGLTDINNGIIFKSDSWKNQTIQAYIGYRIQ